MLKKKRKLNKKPNYCNTENKGINNNNNNGEKVIKIEQNQKDYNQEQNIQAPQSVDELKVKRKTKKRKSTKKNNMIELNE